MRCSRRWTWALAIAVPITASGSGAARATAGRISRLVAGADRLFALRDRSLVIFDGAGRMLGRCAALDAPAEREERSAIGGPDAEETLAAAGLPDDDDETPDAEQALDDEGLGRRARSRHTPEAAAEIRDLAATPAGNEVWIATSSGLFVGRDTGCARAGLGGRELVMVAATGTVVAAASEQLLWRGDATTGALTVAAGLAARPRALAVTDGAHVLVGDDDGVLDVEAGQTAVRILDRPTDALAVCDGIAVALANDGVYLLGADTPPARVGDRPPARTLTCGRSSDVRFIASGVGLWTSPDGISWVERSGGLGRAVTASAALDDRIWFAAGEELVVLEEGAPEPRLPSPARPIGLPPIAPARLVAPLVPWPRVTVLASARETVIRTGWSIAVLLTFPLGRSRTHAPDGAALAAEVLRRDADLAAEQVDLASRSGQEPGAAERAAWTRLLEQERKALR